MTDVLLATDTDTPFPMSVCAGKGGASYDKKKVWIEEIIKPLKGLQEFEGADWPSEHQGVINFVERVVKANTHLFKPGGEQAEPAEPGTEGTKDERLTPFQQARASPCCVHITHVPSLSPCIHGSRLLGLRLSALGWLCDGLGA